MLYEKINELNREIQQEMPQIIQNYVRQQFIPPKRSKMVLNGTVYIDIDNGVYRSVLLNGNPDDRIWQPI